MGNVLLTQKEFTFPATATLLISSISLCPKTLRVTHFLETLLTGGQLIPLFGSHLYSPHPYASIESLPKQAALTR